ncbi:TPA: glycosyltransferase [Streptococcus suis]|nr:glycosyltransferase [Streptococcus suis]
MTYPLVSIVCTVYNKAPWLRKTIEHFLMQETDFSFDILLIDDCSTDGSKEIVAEFAQRFPDKIRAFYNDTNQGIARTWVKICQEVTADYLARCDGDDYWTDRKKLQKQVDALRMNPQSKWVSTDIDYVNEDDKVIARAIFESGLVPKAHDFEQMLATRGFTAPSTWLVETQLMQEVNQEMDITTADDTFDLQLDLFQRTPLTYLPEVTVAYRVNQGSDSRPKEFSKVEHRFNRLLETQETYLDKYPSRDTRKMLQILLERNNHYELELTKKEFGLAQFGVERVTVYYAKGDEGFSQEQIVQFPLAKIAELSLQLPPDCRKIRIDLSESPSFYAYVQLVSTSSGTEVLPSFTNGIVLGNSYIFPNVDPQLIYDIPEAFGKEFSLRYQAYDIDNIQSDDYIAKILSQELLDLKMKVKELEGLRLQTKQQSHIIAQQQQDLEALTHQYHSVIGSRRWIIPTKIINFFRRKK